MCCTAVKIHSSSSYSLWNRAHQSRTVSPRGVYTKISEVTHGLNCSCGPKKGQPVPKNHLLLLPPPKKIKTFPDAAKDFFTHRLDICVQLTCGQRQHAGSVQHEEKQADIRDGFHFPPVGYVSLLSVLSSLSSSCCCDVLFPFSILERNYAQRWRERDTHTEREREREEKKQHGGFKAPGFFLNSPKSSLRSALEKVRPGGKSPPVESHKGHSSSASE